MKVLLLTLALSLSCSAQALVIYDFEGQCSAGCFGTASAVLTLADSFTGTPMTSDFVSFSYTSSSGNFAIPGSGDFLEFFAGSTGTFPALTGTAEAFIDWTGSRSYFVTSTNLFNNFTSGFVDATWAGQLMDGAIIDAGQSYSWTRRDVSVPEPSAVSLLAMGLLVFGFLNRRRRSPL